MGQFFKDIFLFLQSLSMVDYILYFAILILALLIVSLIYVMRFEYQVEKDVSDEVIVLDEDNNLKDIVKAIEETPHTVVDMTLYETEQEEKAIISYEELLKNSKNGPIYYDDEEIVDNEVIVKKINLDQIATGSMFEEVKKPVINLFQYEREEAFLKTLKQLNELLN